MSTLVPEDIRADLLAIKPYRAVAPNPVNQAEIRRWCDAFNDCNPLYFDTAAGQSIGSQGAIAPLAMLPSWVAVPLRSPPDTDPHWRDLVRKRFARDGYNGLIATNLDYEFCRYLTVGERIEVVERVADISDRKITALGEGYFLTSENKYYDEAKNCVGEVRIRVLHFSSEGKRARQGKDAPKARPEKIPGAITSWTVEITPTLVVTCALAANDFEPVHHDYALAREQGLENIITNIPTTAGLIQRNILAHFGGQAFIRQMSLRLGVPNFPGDSLCFSLFPGDADGSFIIKGMNSRGLHVDARVSLEGL